jgi:hypothetical protein
MSQRHGPVSTYSQTRKLIGKCCGHSPLVQGRVGRGRAHLKNHFSHAGPRRLVLEIRSREMRPLPHSLLEPGEGTEIILALRLNAGEGKKVIVVRESPLFQVFHRVASTPWRRLPCFFATPYSPLFPSLVSPAREPVNDHRKPLERRAGLMGTRLAGSPSIAKHVLGAVAAEKCHQAWA